MPGVSLRRVGASPSRALMARPPAEGPVPPRGGESAALAQRPAIASRVKFAGTTSRATENTPATAPTSPRSLGGATDTRLAATPTPREYTTAASGRSLATLVNIMMPGRSESFLTRATGTGRALTPPSRAAASRPFGTPATEISSATQWRTIRAPPEPSSPRATERARVLP